MSELIRRVNCRACGRTHFGLWSQDDETVECPIEGKAVYVATGKVVSEVPDYLTDETGWKIIEKENPEVKPGLAWQPRPVPDPELVPGMQEIEKEIFGIKSELDKKTIPELKELPAWDKVPSPKPTRKADIIKAIENVE